MDTANQSSGCHYCDIGCDPVKIDGVAFHPITNPTKNMLCERPENIRLNDLRCESSGPI